MNEERQWLSGDDVSNPPPSRLIREYWAFMPAGYREVKANRDLRVMKLREYPDKWAIRWGDFGGTVEANEMLPGDLSEEQVKAAAIALWRMK